MTFPPTSPPRSVPRPGGRREGRSPLVLTVVVVAALLAAFVLFVQIYTEALWFKQLGYVSVFSTEWFAKIGLFLGAALFTAFGVWISMRQAYRSRPVYAPTTPQQENLDRYREAIEPLRRVMSVAVPVLAGMFVATSVAARWQDVLLWLNSTSFGVQDPQFGQDVSFYTFTLPVVHLAVNLLGITILFSLVAAVVMHYLYGGLRTGEGTPVTLTRTAGIHITILAIAGLLVLAVRFWLQRFDKVTSAGGLVAGATYTDVNAGIPALTILAIACLLVALAFVAAAATGRWRVPMVGTAALLIFGLVAVWAYPTAVQTFQVNPSQQSLERPYIERNIEGTRAAYGINDVEVTPYTPTTTGETGALREDAATAASIRLQDPNLVSDAFRQLQQIRSYYSFPEQLDVDRYTIEGERQDTVIAARELNVDAAGENASWYNQAIVYTHGFGVVSAYGNRRADDGQPVFSESGIPSTGVLGKYEPRIYFGERSPNYSIVGAPKGAEPRELDYPADADEANQNQSTGQVNNTFGGKGGPSVGNAFNKLAYAIKFQDEQIVLSDAVNPDSQILYDRDPRQRLEKAAPFLTVDGDPYPAVIDGRVKWVLDGYTTSRGYPYSTPQALDTVTQDSNTQRANNVAPLPSEQVNYIRNSVKATVDAYDGSVDMYAWDEKDPVLKSWMKTFPDLVKPVSEMSGELMSHVRYPEDLFKIQRSLLSRYHVTTPDAFYSQQDFWTVPNDPTLSQQSAVAQPPYFLSLKMPGQENQAFSLTSSFIPRPTSTGQTRNVLTGFLAADADAGNTAGQRADSYGKLRLLQLPRNNSVPGPGQAQNNFNAEPEVQSSLNLLRQGESQVQNGNLLTLPIGGGLLYVQPVYVRSAGETSYPVLQRVLVAFGEDIGFAPTLDEALDQIFGGDSGVTTGDADSGDPAGDGAEEKPEATDPSEELTQALEDAKRAMDESEQALQDGDFAKYGEAQRRLQDAIERATRADGAAEVPSPAPAP